ncbi:MAG: integral rane sensor signal transduction histidine kinase [Deferribacteraceae bacterium]|jgi:signal transduction histidine kinase|nr:integral rane sensor signal transduction histidine kinase [Deferribacteraceae bacterium]
MKVKLTIHILILVTAILTILTTINYYQSKQILLLEVMNQAETITANSKSSIEEFLRYIKDISYNISRDYLVEKFLEDYDANIKEKLEEKFLEIYSKLPVIQALRITDLQGQVKVFVREGEVLSKVNNYKEISLYEKDFFKEAVADNLSEIILSNFERGKLPETVNFCPAMVRAVVPITFNNNKAGYLIVNFWGLKIGQFVSRFKKDTGVAFLVEVNNMNKERNGIFLFHRDKSYEFANQYNTSYYFQNIYGKEMFDKLKDDFGIFKINEDIFAFASVYPYKDKARKWVICNTLYSNYYLSVLEVLKKNLLSIFIISVFLSLFVSIFFTESFFKPLNEIKLALNAYGKGDFSYKVDEAKMDNELKEIMKNIYEMVSALQKYILEIEERQKKIELLNRLSSIGLLSAGISHELNTPLNSIILLCDILIEESKNDKVNMNDITDIKNEAKRCVSIIRNLKLLDPQNKVHVNDVVNIREVIESNILYFKNIFNNLVIESSLVDCNILGNSVLLSQVVFNILLNAIEACDSECRISIKVFEKDNKVCIIIRDKGRGMDEETINNIFVPFYTTKNSQKSMGLGLSLVHKIVSDHNGKIEVKSKKGEWTEFVLRFDKYESFGN